MREYKKQTEISPEEHDDTQMKKWLADSHYWIQENGTYHCKWCGRGTTTTLSGDAFLCKENPEIIKYKKGL